MVARWKGSSLFNGAYTALLRLIDRRENCSRLRAKSQCFFEPLTPVTDSSIDNN